VGWYLAAVAAVTVSLIVGCLIWGWLDRRGRRRAALGIAAGDGLPPEVAASLDRARRRAKPTDAGPMRR